MQETVTNTNERKSLFSSFLEVMEAREKQAQGERQLQQEKYLRRKQRIFDFHDRQRRDVAELRRLLDYVSQHTHVLETVLRGAGGAGGEADAAAPVPLSASLVRQAAAVQRVMAQSVANAARIRHLLAATQRPHMDNLLARMEGELRTWTAFVQRSEEAVGHTEVVIDNLRNLCEEQRRTVRELSSSAVLAAGAASAGTPPVGTPLTRAESPLERRPPTTCSTPIALD